jgi:hypothetical protein
MASSGLLCRVALVRSNVSGERIASIIKVDSCHPDDGGDSSFETSVFTRATRCNIPEDGIVHSNNSFILWRCTGATNT